jgi:hypothetical protein
MKMNASKYFAEGLRVEIPDNIAAMIDQGAFFVEFPRNKIVLLEGEKSENLYNEGMKADENLKNLLVQYYLREVGNLESRLKKSALMDVQERYIDFCRQYPHLQDRIDLQYIASYIGIRAASLSRIRKRIKNHAYKMLMKNKAVIVPGFSNKVIRLLPVGLKMKFVAHMKHDR